MKGRIARIFTSFIDVPDAIAVAIFFSGCSIRCKGCQNKDLWDPASGKLMTDTEVLQKVTSNTLADCVAFLGGEPTDQLPFLLETCKQIKQHAKLPIALYTGREFEDLPQELLDHLFMVVCGPYKQELHRTGWPASSNQRVFKKKEHTWGA